MADNRIQALSPKKLKLTTIWASKHSLLVRLSTVSKLISGKIRVDGISAIRGAHGEKKKSYQIPRCFLIIIKTFWWQVGTFTITFMIGDRGGVESKEFWIFLELEQKNVLQWVNLLVICICLSISMFLRNWPFKNVFDSF